ncbi:hypothetical protein HUX53_20530, partial [Actinomadura sp. BRA 177]
MTENDGTQGPQRPLPEDEGNPGPVEGQEPPARPLGDRTVVFGAPQLGGQAGGATPPPEPREDAASYTPLTLPTKRTMYIPAVAVVLEQKKQKKTPM